MNIFWTTYPPSLVNIVCERPLVSIFRAEKTSARHQHNNGAIRQPCTNVHYNALHWPLIDMFYALWGPSKMRQLETRRKPAAAAFWQKRPKQWFLQPFQDLGQKHLFLSKSFIPKIMLSSGHLLVKKRTNMDYVLTICAYLICFLGIKLKIY